jgi:hypothetical protein
MIVILFDLKVWYMEADMVHKEIKVGGSIVAVQPLTLQIQLFVARSGHLALTLLSISRRLASVRLISLICGVTFLVKYWHLFAVHKLLFWVTQLISVHVINLIRGVTFPVMYWHLLAVHKLLY